MKIKRILSLITAVFLIFTVLPQSISADLSDDNLENEKGLLAALGITDTEYNYITRADYAEIIIKALNMEDAASENNKVEFLDVDEEHSKKKYIALANSMGLMGGYSKTVFSPEKEITAAEAITVTLRALGDKRIEDGIHYLEAARADKLLKNLDIVDKAPLDYDNLVILIYNFLHAKAVNIDFLSKEKYTVKAGNTMLESCFDIKILEGVVYSDGYVAVKGNTAGKDRIIIGNTSIRDDKGLASAFLGCSVRSYYIDEDVSTLVYIHEDNHNSIVSYSLDQLYIDGQVIKYDKKSHRFDAATAFIHNSELVTSPASLNALFNSSGYIKIIDNDNDGVCDVVLIETYIVSEVESINIYNQTIKLADNPLIEYGDYKGVAITDNYDNKMVENDIVVGSVFCVAKPKTKNGTVKIIKCESIGSAVISSVNKIQKIVYTDEGLEYKAVQVNLDNISVGEEYKLYLDKFENLVYVQKESSERKLGYIVAAGTKGGIDDTLRFKILDNSGEVKQFEQNTKIRVRLSDGTFRRLMGNALIDALKYTDGANEYIRQPIMYSFRADGKLKEIWLLTDNQSLEFHSLSDLVDELLTAGETVNNLQYRSRVQNIGGVIQMGAECVLYRVPHHAMDISNEKRSLEVVYGTSFLKNATPFNFDGGDVVLTGIAIEKDSFIADALIYEYEDGIPTNCQFYGSAMPIVVTNMIESINDDGEFYTQVTGYGINGKEYVFDYYDEGYDVYGVTNAYNGSSITPVSTATFEKVSKGDIIRYNTELDRISRYNIEIFYDNDRSNNAPWDGITLENLYQTFGSSTSGYRFYEAVRVTPGNILAKQDGDYVMLNVLGKANKGLRDFLASGSTDFDSVMRKEIYKINNKIVYVYNRTKNSLVKLNEDSLNVGDTAIFVMQSGGIEFVVVYED